MCRLSVVLPVYNASTTIDRCIESIVNQTYQDWELICCDDCSEDNSKNILQKWAKKDKRIRILENDKNMRAAYTRNKCIKESKGEYIALIDDDDYCDSRRFEKQVSFLDENTEYSFIGSKAYFFDEDGIWKVSNPVENPTAKDFLWNSCFLNPSTMFRKKHLFEIGLYRIAKETRRGQDYDLFMRLYIAGYKGYNIQEPLVYYYRGKNSYGKCKYEYRIDEAKIRYSNFKKLGLFPLGLIYVIKPIIVGLIPISIIEKIKGKLYETKDKRNNSGI